MHSFCKYLKNVFLNLNTLPNIFLQIDSPAPQDRMHLLDLEKKTNKMFTQLTNKLSLIILLSSISIYNTYIS